MDSLIHRFSSSKCPTMMQVQRRATNRFMETTEAWPEVITFVNSSDKAITTSIQVTIYIYICLCSAYSPSCFEMGIYTFERWLWNDERGMWWRKRKDDTTIVVCNVGNTYTSYFFFMACQWRNEGDIGLHFALHPPPSIILSFPLF